jgi:hypothetical protein
MCEAEELMLRSLDNVTELGAPNCGLVGPFAFPFQWTSQRNRGGRKSSRKSMRRRMDAKGQPLFIEAAPPPIKQLRSLLREFAEHVNLHKTEIGAEFFSLFSNPSTPPVDIDEIVLDLTQVLEAHACPRYGTWKLINEQLCKFYKHFAELQQRAIANGRYFPPPSILRVRVHRTQGVCMEMGFSEGFLPCNKLFVVRLPGSKTGVIYTGFQSSFDAFVQSDEVLPNGTPLIEQIESGAITFCRSGEIMEFAGFIQGLPDYELHHVWHALKEGDELTVRIQEKPYFALFLAWRERTLGRIAHGDTALALHILREDNQSRVVIVLLHDFYKSSFGQIGYAMYRKETVRNETRLES